MTEIFTGLASESGHWYAEDGSPAYETRGANGKIRPVTLRDARKFNLYPSVTTIMQCAAKPQLERWKVQQGILSALTLPREHGEDDTQFANRAMEDSKQQAIKAAARGTLIHSQIEASFKGFDVEPELAEFVHPAVEWVEKNLPMSSWLPERSFAHKRHGYGGKIDLSCIQCVVDFKTKSFIDADLVKAYDEQGMQLAAYAIGLGYGQDCTRLNLFISTDIPGLIVPHFWEKDTFERHWSMFNALLAYWQADKKYYPEYVGD